MRHGSLFTGIGGFDLAASWMGWENVFQVEKDEWCQRVLAKNFPNTKRYGDIDGFNGEEYRGAIDVLSGGPPCQPASGAGKRKGEKDDRWKWPEAIRVFGEIRPGIGVFENPDDLLSLDNGRAFERICRSLEDFGYNIETYGIPASCLGAWHDRDRIWIIAYSDVHDDAGGLVDGTNRKETRGGESQYKSGRQASFRQRVRTEFSPGTEIISNPYTQGLQESTRTKLRRTHAEIGSYWKTEPGVVRMVHGFPGRVDRIKSLGNAIVPQIAFEIFKAIEVVTKETIIP